MAKRNKRKRKQKKPDRRDDESNSDSERRRSEEREPSPEPEPSSGPGYVLGPDPEERPPWEDNVRVPPILIEFDLRIRKNLRKKTHTSTSQQMRLFRHLTRAPVGRSRVLGSVPLDKLEPLVAHNRRTTSKSPQRTALMTPEQLERRRRAAELCPCRKTGLTNGHAERPYPRPYSKFYKYASRQRAMREAYVVIEPVPEPVPNPVPNSGPASETEPVAGPSRPRLIHPVPVQDEIETDSDSFDTDTDSTTTDSSTFTGSTDSAIFDVGRNVEEHEH